MTFSSDSQMVANSNPPKRRRGRPRKNPVSEPASLPLNENVTNPTIPSSPTQPSTSTSKSDQTINSRTRLDSDDHLVLIRLCVTHQTEYVEGKKGDFWAKISILLERETNKKLKDPSSTVKGWVIERRMIAESEKKESGTVQTDSEMTQALDEWIEMLDFLEKEKDKATKSQEHLDREAAEAGRRRDNLLKPQGTKHIRNEGEEPEEPEEIARTSKRKQSKSALREQFIDREIEAGHEDVDKLVTAVADMGSQLAGAIRSLSQHRETSTLQVQDTETAQRLTRLEERGERQDDILTRILEHVAKLSEKAIGQSI